MPDDGNQIVLLTDNQLIEQVDFLSVEDEYNYTENWILTHAVKSVEPNLGDFNYAA